MDYLTSPLRHLAVVRDWMSRNGAEGSVNPVTFALVIRCKNRRIILSPKFVFRSDGRLAYSQQFQGEESVFVGWLPYAVTRWDISGDKLQFKDLMQVSGLRAPESVNPRAAQNDYIIKRRRGSFGQDMAGPYSKSHVCNIESDQFAEAFINGKSAKAWYWAGSIVAIEIVERPYIVADGERSLSSIASDVRGSFDIRYSIESANPLLSYQGINSDSIPEKGRRFYLDYRHASVFDRVVKADRNVLDKIPSDLRKQFVDAGRVCAEYISSVDGRERLFSLDAVVDDAGTAWFLEINSNPMVHPKAYPPMLTSIFAGEAGVPVASVKDRADKVSA